MFRSRTANLPKDTVERSVKRLLGGSSVIGKASTISTEISPTPR